jgi:ribose transport system substrate-binding protein
MNPLNGPSPRRRWLLLALIAFVVGSLVVAACGDDDSDQGEGEGAASNGQACGTIPDQMPDDPDGVLTALPKKLQEAYNGLPVTMQRSPWADWKPKHDPPFKVGVSFPTTQTPFGADFIKRVQELGKQEPNVSEVIVRISNNNVATQVQQLRGLIRDEVDIIIAGSLSLDAEVPVVREATKAGIPFIEFTGPPPPAPGAIGFFTNNWLAAAEMAQKLVRQLDGEGRVLMVHGIPQTKVDQITFAGANAVFDRCPDIETVGNLDGQFSPPVAKAETLKFLSANPQPIDAVVQTAGMAVGILQAFEQSGREIPPIADQGATPGFLAYWAEHRDSYHPVASGQGAVTTTDLVWEIAMRTLAGEGPKLNNIFLRALLITDENLDEWVKPEWTPSTIQPAYADPPDRDQLVTNEEMDEFFTKPGAASK